MIIQIRQEILLNLLKKASTGGVLFSLPSLQSFLLEVEGSQLKVLRTDGDFFVVAKTDLFSIVDSVSPNQILVEEGKLLSLVEALLGKDIKLSFEKNNKLKIEAEGFQAVWLGISFEGYPEFPTIEESSSWLAVEKGVVSSALERVYYAAGSGYVRKDLNQIVFEKNFCWATDGYRYQRVTLSFKDSSQVSFPREGLRNLLQFIKFSSEESLHIGGNDNFTGIHIGEDIFLFRRSKISPLDVEEAFFKKVNLQGDFRFLVEVSALKKAIQRATATCLKNEFIIFLTIVPTELIIGAKGAAGNFSTETLVINVQGELKGEERKLPLHYDTLLDALNSVKDKMVTFAVYKNRVFLLSEDSLGILPVLKG